jgi:hypothetical protein
MDQNKGKKNDFVLEIAKDDLQDLQYYYYVITNSIKNNRWVHPFIAKGFLALFKNIDQIKMENIEGKALEQSKLAFDILNKTKGYLRQWEKYGDISFATQHFLYRAILKYNLHSTGLSKITKSDAFRFFHEFITAEYNNLPDPKEELKSYTMGVYVGALTKAVGFRIINNGKKNMDLYQDAKKAIGTLR